jgi:hypothetical protein
MYRLADGCFDTKPFFDSSDITERDTRLNHTPGAGIHAKKNDLFRAIAVPLIVLVVGLPCIIKRVVDMGHRITKP